METLGKAFSSATSATAPPRRRLPFLLAPPLFEETVLYPFYELFNKGRDLASRLFSQAKIPLPTGRISSLWATPVVSQTV